jgi:hypothetical protein
MVPMKLQDKQDDLVYTYQICEKNDTSYIVVINRKNEDRFIKKFKDKPIKICKTKQKKDDDGSIILKSKEYISYEPIKKLLNEDEFEEFDNLVKLGNNFKFDIVNIENSIDYPYATTQKRNGNIYFNLYNYPSKITKNINKESQSGNFNLIKTYLNNIFGENGYHQIVNFLAYRYQNPLKLVDFSFVFTGSKQIGKSSFSEYFLPAIFGDSNIAISNISSIDQLNFNSSIVGKMFVNFDEFHLQDKNAIEYFKHKIKAKKHELHEKGKEKEDIPNLSNYIFTNNSIPSILENMHDARRFVVRKLKKKLYVENSTIDDFLSEIPCFIDYISNLEVVKPKYEDFDCCNDIMDFNHSKNDDGICAVENYIEEVKENSKEKIENIIGLTKDSLDSIYNYYVLISGDDAPKKETFFKSFKEMQKMLFNSSKFEVITGKTTRIHGKIYNVCLKILDEEVKC